MRAAAIGFESGFHRRGDARIVFSSTGFNLNIIANIDFESGFHRRGDARIVFSPTGFNLNIIANIDFESGFSGFIGLTITSPI